MCEEGAKNKSVFVGYSMDCCGMKGKFLQNTVLPLKRTQGRLLFQPKCWCICSKCIKCAHKWIAYPSIIYFFNAQAPSWISWTIRETRFKALIFIRSFSFKLGIYSDNLIVFNLFLQSIKTILVSCMPGTYSSLPHTPFKDLRRLALRQTWDLALF